MTATAGLQSRLEFDELPLYLPDQNAVLIGYIFDGESELEGKAAYYIHWRDGIHIGKYHAEDQVFAPAYEIQADSRVMSHQAMRLLEMDVEVELSSIGAALITAYEYEDTGLLPTQQAHVLALREHGFERQAIGEILNINVSTVDNHRRSATKKAVAARDFMAIQEQAVPDSSRLFEEESAT